MDTQTDTPNVKTITHNTTGVEIDRYFGCWLDINQPDQKWFPLNPTNDGPYTGSLKSVLELIRNQHQCLISEIAFDPEPIRTGATPGTSDKLAQRNLSLVASANPGDVTSRLIPNTFELKPTQDNLDQIPDELMIDWGNTPSDSIARIYLPTVSADEILEMAAKHYSAAKLTRVDDHTVECPVHAITYVPIPPGQSLNHAGLLTVDLPDGVQSGQLFNIVVRQVTHQGEMFSIALMVEGARDAHAEAAQTPSNWRSILGTFQISIPVQTKDVMLEPEERLFSILQWILESIPSQDRWYAVFRRYVAEIGHRVQGLGGNPALIPPSPTGDFQKPRPYLGGLELEAQVTFSGKVSGLVYDRFGDFEGFLLDTEDGDLRFHSREHEVENLVHRAWTERIAITVFAKRDVPHRPMSIILRSAPRPFQG